jgi:hypothetical protein
MSLILLVRRGEDVRTALSEASELLALQRRFQARHDEPGDAEHAIGVWVHPDLDEALPSWAPTHDELVAREADGMPKPRVSRVRTKRRVAVRSAVNVTGRWSLCWLDDLALLGGYGHPDRFVLIEHLLEALAEHEPERGTCRFFPIFGVDDDEATIAEFMAELGERHAGRVAQVHFTESQDLGLEAAGRSAA